MLKGLGLGNYRLGLKNPSLGLEIFSLTTSLQGTNNRHIQCSV